MKRKTLIMLCVLVGASIQQSWKEKENTAMTSGNDNPLIAEWNTPVEVRPFDLIENNHFKPAIVEGIKDQEEEIKNIINSTEKPTFENVVVAIDKVGCTI